MQFIFNGYQLPMTDAVKDAASIVVHYRQFSEKSGAAFEPPETAFALLAGVLLFEQNQVDEGIAVLEENVRRHPSSPEAHSYLGRAYLAKEDKAAALRCFERVLQLRPGDEEAAQFLKSAREVGGARSAVESGQAVGSPAYNVRQNSSRGPSNRKCGDWVITIATRPRVGSLIQEVPKPPSQP
jgi:tetratricopeptide (TPR) repeat protein